MEKQTWTLSSHSSIIFWLFWKHFGKWFSSRERWSWIHVCNLARRLLVERQLQHLHHTVGSFDVDPCCILLHDFMIWGHALVSRAKKTPITPSNIDNPDPWGSQLLIAAYCKPILENISLSKIHFTPHFYNIYPQNLMFAQDDVIYRFFPQIYHPRIQPPCRGG